MANTFTADFELDPARDIRNVEGAPSWFELSTGAPEEAARFLSAVFGWEYAQVELGGADYQVIKVKGHEVGGIRAPMHGADTAPTWVTYVTVADAEAIASKATSAGGEVAVPPTDLPGVGRMVVVRHPDAGQVLGFEYARPFE